MHCVKLFSLAGLVKLNRLRLLKKVKQPMKQRRKFTADFKSKVALEALRDLPVCTPLSGESNAC